MTFARTIWMTTAVAATLGGCAPSLRHDAPDELYRQLVESNGWPRCTRIEDAALQEARDERITERFDAVRPWLAQQIGEVEIDRIYQANLDELGTISFIGCPSDNFSAWQRMTVRRALREMERRQRADARVRRPAAGLPEDIAR